MRPSRGRRRRARLQRDGQLDGERAALALDRVNGNRARHALHEVLHDAQPEPRALLGPRERRVRLPERLEDRAPERLGDPAARVGDLDPELRGPAHGDGEADIALLAEFLGV